MKISMIVAMDENNGIGKEGQMLWHLPKDFKWMKDKTMGHVIVMGRNCYNDIIRYSKGKPLPGRKNIVLTSKNTETINEGFFIEKTISDILSKYKNEDKIFILGGGQIYNAFLPYADELVITHVHQKFNADIFFPQVDYSKFNKIYEQNEEEKNIKFTFTIYDKKPS